MNVVKIVGMPLVVLLENLSSVMQAKSIVNARDAAADTALRSRAHRALSETNPAALGERSSAWAHAPGSVSGEPGVAERT